MSTVEDFENAPVGATATHPDGSRAMKMDGIERRWVASDRVPLDDEEVEHLGFTRDPLWPAPESAREALDLAWNLAHEVKARQIIPKGTRYLTGYNSEVKEYAAQFDIEITPELTHVYRTLEPLLEPDWLDAPAVLANVPGTGKRGVFIPTDKEHWAVVFSVLSYHWSELEDVTPLWPKENEK